MKDKLVELLPKFKKKINKELEEKNKTLSENPGKDDKRFPPHSLHTMVGYYDKMQNLDFGPTHQTGGA